MGGDAGVESASPSSPSISSHFSQQLHFYVAVDRLQYKMVTLLDLLGMAGHRPGLPMVVSCSSRDELDAVCSAVSTLPFISLASLYSDLAEVERGSILEKFRQATTKWNQKVVDSGEDSDTGKDEQKSYMIVVTDACLPLLSSGESPIAAHVLINYELPTKKETYMRRMTTCLATDGIVINMVVGGEVVTLKNIEESSNLLIAEMPINIYEIL
ncbi:P-loop containing nucleoside triphosphate hydrolase [Trema orientale]|uniref:P-loop containing nucleoside triphosphate hydrolase n=1 Tax=Trema orientale TaxID=63057 RepID=A0A2P5FYE0_TREOI|nr:P-loop containing nucleoside triphosphate hydrolase [Trema orientale]